MGIKFWAFDNFLKMLALLSLALALRDASSLLGVGLGEVNPITIFGTTSFILMGIFTIFRLFASVGMWIGAGWGAPLLLIVTIVEFGLLFLGNYIISIGVIGSAIRIFLFFGVLLWLVAHYFRQVREN